MKLAAKGVCASAFAAVMFAQVFNARIEGLVLDPTGAAAGSARITFRLASTGKEISVVSIADGHYASPPLEPGLYEVKVEIAGFNTLRMTLRVASGEQRRQDFTLSLGSVSETVTVTASTPSMQTESSSVSSSSASRKLPRWRRERSARQAPSIPQVRTPANEEYAEIREEGFQSVSQRPLSTFSADVDTASYANVRRFLRDGKLPPKDAVRIEELLNYFRYSSYPEPEGKAPVAFKLEMAECPWNPDHALLQVGVKARTVSKEAMPPANLVFLIDVSGSMSDPNKLPLLKESFGLLVNELRPHDRVAIVVYAGAAGLVLDSTPGSDKARIGEALDRLRAGGSTAGGAGLRLAYEVARRNFRRGSNNRVILATDGDFNVGESSDSAMVKLIESERDQGIFLTVLGYGYGNLKDSKLEKIADHGNGNYAYIDSLTEARKVLVREMGGTLFTVAKDVKLQVEFNPVHIQGWRLIGYENRRLKDEDFEDDRKDAGDMGAGHVVTALYELVPRSVKSKLLSRRELKYANATVESRPVFAEEALTVRMRYKQPDRSRSREISGTLGYSKGAISEASQDLRFASGVAEFGLVLAESRDRRFASLESAARQMSGALGDDPDGTRAEMLFLAKTARSLGR